MKFTLDQLREVESDIRGVASYGLQTRRVAGFLRDIIASAEDDEPDTIELFFTFGVKMGSVGSGPNPFMREDTREHRTCMYCKRPIFRFATGTMWFLNTNQVEKSEGESSSVCPENESKRHVPLGRNVTS